MKVNNNFECVIAFGGSTVSGSELSDDPDTRLSLAFPNLVASKFNVPCYNYAWAGGSNQRALRLLPEALLEHPNSLVLFNWVSFDRSEFFWSDESYKGAKSPEADYLPIGISWLTFDIDPWLKHVNKLWFKSFYCDPTYHNNYREYNSLFTVDTICKQYCRDFVHIFELPNLFNNHADRQQQKVWQAIDKSKILQFKGNWSDKGYNLGYGNFFDYARNQNWPFGNTHFLHEAHYGLADLIINHISR